MTDKTHALYRFYSATDDLLYVGVTLDPGSRWNSHRKEKPWWHEVSRVTVEAHPSRQAVLEAERQAILAEKPRYNVVHNGRGRQSSYRGCRCSACLMGLVHDWGACAEDMPDDCHDICAKSGICGIYYPFRWREGRAHYVCQNGHYWTCGWGHQRSGDASQWRGKPAETYIVDDSERVVLP